MNNREETGMVSEEMGIHPASYTPNKDSGMNNTPIAAEVVRFEGLLLGGGGSICRT